MLSLLPLLSGIQFTSVAFYLFSMIPYQGDFSI